MRIVLSMVFLCCLLQAKASVAHAQNPTNETFTQFVAATKGVTSNSVREKIQNNDHIFLSDPPSADGHYYLSLNSLGFSDLSPEQVMTEIKADPDSVFPYFTVAERNTKAIKLGNIYDLDLVEAIGANANKQIPIVGSVANNPVEVTDVGPNHFIFTVLPGHFLEGSAAHGILKDSTGELWLFQEGRGVAGERERLQQLNYWIAEAMWARMAASTNSLIDKVGRFSGRKVSVRLNSYCNTQIPIERGDRVKIAASGIIKFGIIAGPGGPKGIDYGTRYNYFSDVRHGALFGQIGDHTFVIGQSVSFISPSKGLLELNVNDSNSIDNIGSFTVEIMVPRPTANPTCNPAP